MPADNGTTLAKGVSASFQQLAKAAADLNLFSDALGDAIGRINDRLNGLRLGTEAWICFECTKSGVFEEVYSLGYCRLSTRRGTWGIAIRFESRTDEGTEEEIKSFLEASREIRLKSIPKLPELIAELAERVRAKAVEIAPIIMQLQQFEDELGSIESTDEDVPF